MASMYLKGNAYRDAERDSECFWLVTMETPSAETDAQAIAQSNQDGPALAVLQILQIDARI